MSTITRFIPADKQEHILAGALIAVAAFVLATFFAPLAGLISHWLVPAFGAWSKAVFSTSWAALAGAGKEALDWLLNWRNHLRGLLPEHDVDVFDFLATAGGGVFAVACITLLIWAAS
jgi:hypothetical protein